MSFMNAHHFTIGNVNAVDRCDENEFKSLTQAACLGAGYQSEERYDAPKCHPETRKAVIDDIMSWVNSESAREPLMWMSGPAGAGKSSIAHSVCERCNGEGKLLASFFFSRSALGTGRNNGNKLIPTIAYQLVISVPHTKDIIDDALRTDPAVLSYSMEVQLQKLVFKPFARVSVPQSNQNGTCQRFPYLIVIDGLDECNDLQMQARIVTTIANLLSKEKTHIRFLFASRPELEIRIAFNSSSVHNKCAQVVLDEHYRPGDDIRLYLRSEFALLKREHPLKSLRFQESKWPSISDMEWLVEKSSGQFIYPSTVMKYLKHPRRDPKASLQSIITERSAGTLLQSKLTQSPYSEIDGLYSIILNNATSNFLSSDDFESMINVFQVLLCAFSPTYWSKDLRQMENLAMFLAMEQDNLELLLSDLHSILHIPEVPVMGYYDCSSYAGKMRLGSLLDQRPLPQSPSPCPPPSTGKTPNRVFGQIRFYHASFGDFLKSSSRSGHFYIDKTEAHAAIARHCISRLAEYQPPNMLGPAQQYSRDHLFIHIKMSGYNNALLGAINSEQPLRLIMSLLINLNDLFEVTKIGVKHFNIQLKCFYKFDIGSSSFAVPVNDRVNELCLLMSRTLDDLILSAHPSVDTAERAVVISITEIASMRQASKFSDDPSMYLCWLAKLLEDPGRGRHLHLDSKKAIKLYFKICSNYKFRESCVGSWQAEVLQYLLAKIEPSANLDIHIFRAMSKGVIDEIRSPDNNPRVRDERKSLATQSVEDFIQKCLVLRETQTFASEFESMSITRNTL